MMEADPRADAVRQASDPDQVHDRLAAWFADRGRPETVAGVTLERVFYVPGAEFTAVYKLTLCCGGETTEQVLSGSIRYEGDDRALVAKAERRLAKGKFVVPAVGSPVYHLPEWSFVLWSFPNDPKLRTLPACLRPEVIREALGRLPGPGAANGGSPQGGRWRAGAFTQALVRYIPRRRCVFRLDVEWRQERSANGEPAALPSSVLQRVFAKVYDAEPAASLAFRVQEMLYRAAAGENRGLRVPRPLYLDVENLTLYQSALPGTHLAQRANAVTAAHLGAIARGLAQLQQARLPLAAAHSLEDELEKTRDGAALVARAAPQFAPTLEALVGKLAASLPRLPRLPLVPCHGTFKLNHILEEGGRLGLVDFDSMVRGDPLYDVANFTADLHYLEASGALPDGRAAALGRIFYDAWSDQVPWGRRDAALDWYVASLLLRKQALKPVKHLHAGAAAKIGRVLAAAQERLGG